MSDKPKRYLKVTPSCDYKYDDFYYDITGEKTWKGTLENIESELDTQYNDKDGEVVGIKLTIEIVDELPEGIENE